MSSTAQKQDITDPEVVAAFVAKVKTERRLAALYLLTVADIRGTSPQVWNAWKAKLLEDLFHAAKARLSGDSGRGLQDSLDARRAEAARRLRLYAVPEGAEQKLWQRLDGVYFQRHTADEIAWHARHLYFRVDGAEPVVKTRLRARGCRAAGDDLPPRSEGALRAHLRILRPRAIVDTRGEDPHHAPRVCARYLRRPRSGQSQCHLPRGDELHRVRAQAGVDDARAVADLSARTNQPPPQALPLTPEIRIFPDDKGTHFILEIVAGDRPGLLSRIAYVLASANVNVESAKINTLGERAEDVFLLDGARLHDEAALLKLEHRALRSIAAVGGPVSAVTRPAFRHREITRW